MAEQGCALNLIHLFSLDDDQAAYTQLGLIEIETDALAQLAPSESSTAAWACQVVQRQNVTLGEIEEALMQAALQSSQGNISKADALHRTSRAQLDYRVKKSRLLKKIKL